jgi:hypothetical protein
MEQIIACTHGYKDYVEWIRVDREKAEKATTKAARKAAAGKRLRRT